jgi:hypothetical protein
MEPVTGEDPTLPAGHLLLDEPNTADLRVKVTQAWQEFAHALAALLPTMTDGSRLDLTLDPTATGTGEAVYAVTVLAGPEGALEAYAVGNASLPEGYRMDRRTVADLVALGWSPPGVVPGSGEHFGLTTRVGAANDLARVLARTMRDIYGAPHPAFLVYMVHDASDRPMHAAALGGARPEEIAEEPGGDDADESPQPDGSSGTSPVLARPDRADAVRADPAGAQAKLDLPEQVRVVVSSLLKTEPDQLQVDGDGDIGIRAGSAMVFVRVRDNPPLVDVFSPVLTEVRPTQQLYVRLSELTNRMPIGRLYCTDDTVWASIPVFGRNFQAVHLVLAVQVMTGLADELDDRLHGEFGGRRFFGEGDNPTTRGPGERTGMYL